MDGYSKTYIYEEFITDTSQFEFWANSFKQNYFYDCELGNTMPLAMANALSVSFVVFTSHECSSPYYVIPIILSSTVLYLAYNLHGSGHYDACVPHEDHHTAARIVKCRCGVNRKNSDKERFSACNTEINIRHSSCKNA